ncbi:MAG TPA: hypothetical protein VGM37_01725 [Armatimonadota bacterium]|jgi:hypothetical protein
MNSVPRLAVAALVVGLLGVFCWNMAHEGTSYGPNPVPSSPFPVDVVGHGNRDGWPYYVTLHVPKEKLTYGMSENVFTSAENCRAIRGSIMVVAEDARRPGRPGRPGRTMLRRVRLGPGAKWRLMPGMVSAPVTSVSEVTSSPNGLLTAVIGSSRLGRSAVLVDWRTRACHVFPAFPRVSFRSVIELACDDQGSVYVWRIPFGSSDDPYPVTRYQEGRPAQSIGSFDKVVTNGAGAFGIRSTWSRPSGEIEVRATPLDRSRPDRVFHAIFSPATAKFPESLLGEVQPWSFSDVVSSDDGELWAALPSGGNYGICALIIWQTGHEQPIHIVTDPTHIIYPVSLRRAG